MTDKLIDKARELVGYYSDTGIVPQVLPDTLRALIARLEAAEKYIELSPCDPDIFPDQHEAWKAWCAIRADAKGEA